MADAKPGRLSALGLFAKIFWWRLVISFYGHLQCRALQHLIHWARKIDLPRELLRSGAFTAVVRDARRSITVTEALLQRYAALKMDRGLLGRDIRRLAVLIDEFDNVVEGWELVVDPDFLAELEGSLVEIGVDLEQPLAGLHR
ncbi:MAG: hypothetical protein GC160_02740 [Acidobacteria bacterium]|nr:hypothetical protein [Acidobacteriota bacterium]